MSYDFNAWRTVKSARQQHKCEWCGEPIPPGASYERAAGKSEGDFYSLPMHPECTKPAAELYHDTGEGFEPFAHKRGSGEER
jgi:hypothetical protein